MTSPVEENRRSAGTLLPHQVAFIDAVNQGDPFIVLKCDPGLGKDAAVRGLVAAVLSRPTARVLILAPNTLLSQLSQLREWHSVRSLLVDRYRYREMLESAHQGDVWPQGVAVLLSPDFAKQVDITESLCATRWDLVVADEAQAMTGSRAEAFRRVAQSAERVVVVALPGPGDLASLVPKGSTVVEWRRDDVLGTDGTPLVSVPRPAVREVPFSLPQWNALSRRGLEISLPCSRPQSALRPTCF